MTLGKFAHHLLCKAVESEVGNKEGLVQMLTEAGLRSAIECSGKSARGQKEKGMSQLRRDEQAPPRTEGCTGLCD